MKFISVGIKKLYCVRYLQDQSNIFTHSGKTGIYEPEYVPAQADRPSLANAMVGRHDSSKLAG